MTDMDGVVNIRMIINGCPNLSKSACMRRLVHDCPLMLGTVHINPKLFGITVLWWM